MANPKLCSIPDCDKPHEARGWCNAHYQRWRRHGDPIGVNTPDGETERFYLETVLQYEGGECLLWPYGRTSKGYARANINGKNNFIHRLVCTEEHGAPPTPEHQAAHSCGNGSLGCVAKGHLSWKTPKGNQADRLVHGTHNRGTQHSLAKLTEQDVRRIRAMKGTHTRREVAELFGVKPSTVKGIHARHSWAWLD